MKKVLSLVMSILLLVSFMASAFADGFTVPSIEAKEAPEIVTPKDESGNALEVEKVDEKTGEVVVDPDTGKAVTEPVIALIKDGNKDDSKILEDKGLVPVSRLELTPLSYIADEKTKIEKNVSEEAEKMLTQANKDFEDAAAKAEITSINSSKQTREDLKKELDERAKEVKETYTANNYVAIDIFDVQVTQDYLDKLDDGKAGNYLELIYNYNVPKDAPMPAVLFKCDEDEDWTLIPKENVINNGDGTITVRVDRLCVFAFLELSDEVVTPTKNNAWKWVLWICIALLLLFIFIILLLKRRKDDDEEEEKKKAAEAAAAAAAAGTGSANAGDAKDDKTDKKE